MPVRPIQFSGFNAAFYAQETTPPPADATALQAGSERLSFTGQTAHGVAQSVEAFERSEAFGAFQQQFIAGLEHIKQFARDQQLPDEAGIGESLERLKEHLVTANAAFFGEYKAQLFGFGKRCLDEFCQQLGNETIGLATRRQAVRELAEGVSKCGPRVATALATELATLDRAGGGLRAVARQVQEDLIDAHLLRFVRQRCANGQSQREQWLASMESHYVSKLKHHLGLGPKDLPPDHFWGSCMITDQQMSDCAQELLQEITPVNVAQHLARQCLQGIEQTVAGELGGASIDKLDPGGEAWTIVTRAIEGAAKDFGPVQHTSVVALDDEEGSMHLHKDASLVAVDVLQAMHEQGLAREHPPVLLLGWSDRGMTCTVRHLDERLCWATEEGGGAKAKISIGLAHLQRLAQVFRMPQGPAPALWQLSGASLSTRLAASLADAAIAAETPQALRKLPSAWLVSASVSGRYLQKIGPEQALAWVHENRAQCSGALREHIAAGAAELGQAAVLREISQPLDAQMAGRLWQRCDGTRQIRHALLGSDAPLLQVWLDLLRADTSLSQEAVAQILTARNGAGTPVLFDALYKGKGEIATFVRDGIVELARSQRLAPQAVDVLLAAKNADEFPGLHVALQEGRAHSIEALVGGVLQARESGWLTNAEVHALFAAKNPRGLPGLHLAFQEGRAESIKVLLSGVVQARDSGWLGNAELRDLLAAKDADDGVPGVYRALNNGHAESIKEFVSGVLQSRQRGWVTNAELRDLFVVKRQDGLPGLYLALQNGHSTSVRELVGGALQARLSGWLTNTEAHELLAAKDARGVPGLFMALHNGHAESIKALVDGVLHARQKHWLTDHQVHALFAAKAMNDLPGLHFALQEGHAEGARALIDGVLQARNANFLADTQTYALLAARSQDGIPGLSKALEDGHVESVKAVVNGVLQARQSGWLTDIEVNELLAAKDQDGTPGLYFALQEGHAESIKELARGVLQARQNSWLTDHQVHTLLAARGTDDVPGLYMALQEGHADSIKVFIGGVLTARGLNWLGDVQVQALFAAQRDDGVPGLYTAMKDGSAHSVKELIAGIAQASQRNWLNDTQVYELFAARTRDGLPGLYRALQYGHTDNIKEFVRGVLHTRQSGGLTDHQVHTLFSAKDMHGTPGLLMALQGGHADSINAFSAGVLQGRQNGWLSVVQVHALLTGHDADVPFTVKRRRVE
ncbi:ankyrin repeat protein [Variovorax boronicumulans]|uniref:hypothetical protein n=1 Tax=Variovorax boronicumulans TaxID=436515 RepID=UPI00277DCFB4|nr:hypothetical protein [Variovorax boronicumulans]MDQ0083796.1 ankyrin repeat protein [Variovorax boronicumulans]